jgi:acetyl-CoA C-acetyltransferase
MREAWIIDTCRTPRGKGRENGRLAGLHPQHVAATVLRAIAERNDLNTADVDDVVWGTSVQIGTQGSDLGRMAALDAGFDVTVSGVTLSRFCGSGLTSVSLAAASVISGMADMVIAGGTEMMSSWPSNKSITSFPFLDAGNRHLRALHPMTHQGIAADAIAAMEKIPRVALDELSAESQRRAQVAIQDGRFERSLVPVFHPDGGLALSADEHPRPGTTAARLADLAPAFAELADESLDEEGNTYRNMVLRRYPDLEIKPVHHAGSSSGVVDGAAAVLIASDEFAQRHGLRPRARVTASTNMGDDPTLMLNAPVPAVQKILTRAGLSLDSIDLFEINEAFAVVPEKFIRDLKLDREKVNVNGGAIALGHPIGATGAILIGTVLDELERTDGRYGLVTMCAAAGMAPAVIIERI